MKVSGIIQILTWACLAPIATAWTPGTGSPNAAAGFTVDTTNRRDTLAFYQVVYKASETYAADMAWTGSTSTWVPGTTSATFKDHVRRRINFYRALVGLPGDITFNATKSAKCQEAALMFVRNNALSHSPPASWLSDTPNAVEAASKSNIALGTYGPPAVDGFIRDDGSGNAPVGHRRWFLFSRAQEMGTGDIPPTPGKSASNATWVTSDFKPAPAPFHLKWPNEGFVPLPLVPARWSLSYPGAYFDNATVTMTRDGNNVPLSIISNIDDGAGDNTVVWEPTGLPTSASADVTYQVTVSNINVGGSIVGGTLVGGTYHNHSYSVTIFDPENLGESVSLTGSATPYTTGSLFSFNPIDQADSYELLVAQTAASTWTEGAEDATSAFVSPALTGYTTLRQANRKRTGSKAFQLTFPNSSSMVGQSFVITRNFIPTASSSLNFYQLAQATGTSDLLSAQVSNNGGSSWSTVWTRNGNGGSTSQTTFQSASASLAAYAGQILRIRFLLEYKGGVSYLGTASNTGFFIDDISVSNASDITSQTITALPSSAASFTLNSTTAGAALVAGTSYTLSIRPSVGNQWFNYGPLKTVVPQTPLHFDAWAAIVYPTVTGGQPGDHDKDGHSNAIEYAFGLNPLISNPSSAVPQPVISNGNLTVTFQTPAGVTGVTYGAQWSPNLVDWYDLTDTGSGATHTFSVSTAGKPTLFFRHRPVVSP